MVLSARLRAHTPSAALGNVPQAALRAFFFLRHGARPIAANIAKLPVLMRAAEYRIRGAALNST
jgi:hypothetical protein